MLAVLIDAIRTLAAGSMRLPPRQRLAWLRDRAWMQREDLTDPFSFVNICYTLGLSAGYIRRKVQRLQEDETGLKLHRYAAKVEESWERQRRRADQVRPRRRSRNVVSLSQRAEARRQATAPALNPTSLLPCAAVTA